MDSDFAYDVWTEEMKRGVFNLDTMRHVDPVIAEAEMVKREHQTRLRVRNVAERFRDALLLRAPKPPKFPKCFRRF